MWVHFYFNLCFEMLSTSAATSIGTELPIRFVDDATASTVIQRR